MTIESKNKAVVLEAFDTLFNRRDYAAAERYWSPDYVQHSAHIAPRREGLFNLIKRISPTLKYEPDLKRSGGQAAVLGLRTKVISIGRVWSLIDCGTACMEQLQVRTNRAVRRTQRVAEGRAKSYAS